MCSILTSSGCLVIGRFRSGRVFLVPYTSFIGSHVLSSCY